MCRVTGAALLYSYVAGSCEGSQALDRPDNIPTSIINPMDFQPEGSLLYVDRPTQRR